MANVAVSTTTRLPQTSKDGGGYRVDFVNSATKVAQNDTLTITGATTVVWAVLTDDTTGTVDNVTLATNVITLKASTTGTVSGIIYYN